MKHEDFGYLGQRNAATLPETSYFPKTGYWRYRGEDWWASSSTRHANLLSLHAGEIQLQGLSWMHCYLGQGLVVADEMTWDGDELQLAYNGNRPGWPNPPGYYLPLGAPVEMGPESSEFSSSLARRSRLHLPSPAVNLRITPQPDGIDIHLDPVSFLDKVSGMLALDFVPGPQWTSEEGRVETFSGQTILFGGETARLEQGEDWMEISPGAWITVPSAFAMDMTSLRVCSG